MISFLSSPKPFIGITKTNQMNAIRSWLAISEDVEVVLYGDSEGAKEAAQEVGMKHIASIKTNEYGTPLFNSIAEHASNYANHEYQVYINCDIILTPNFANTIRRIRFPQFLMVGQRIDLDEGIIWAFDEVDFWQQLARLHKTGNINLHPPAGSDYFAFKRGLWDSLPTITIGRGGYDNALIHYALSRKIPVVDATLSVHAIHQYHDYSHVARGRKDIFDGPEALRNIENAGKFGVPSLSDATWIIDRQNCLRNYGRGDWMRYLECYCRFVKRNDLLGRFCRESRRVLLRLGLSKQKNITLNEILKN